jgi:hypothetical protein
MKDSFLEDGESPEVFFRAELPAQPAQLPFESETSTCQRLPKRAPPNLRLSPSSRLLLIPLALFQRSIDPWRKLIDRQREDNVADVETRAAAAAPGS